MTGMDTTRYHDLKSLLSGQHLCCHRCYMTRQRAPCQILAAQHPWNQVKHHMTPLDICPLDRYVSSVFFLALTMSG